MLPYKAKETADEIRVKESGDGEIILDYLGGPNLTI